MWIRSLWLIAFLPGAVWAEQGCAPGFYPGGMQPNGQICVPIPGYGTTNHISSPSSAQPAAIWSDRWGAVAVTGKSLADDGASVVGMASSTSSKREARQEALDHCAEKGGVDCRLQMIYKNQCAAVSWGAEKGRFVVGDSIADAEEQAMRKCIDDGDSDCVIYYSDCSLPVRVQ